MLLELLDFGKAIELASKNIDEYSRKLIELRENYIFEIQRKIPYTKLNGHKYQRLPGNANISFEGINGGALVLLLAEQGICCSSASACSTGDTSPSHVLKAIGLNDELAKGTIRMTFGEENTLEDIRYITNVLENIVSRQRSK